MDAERFIDLITHHDSIREKDIKQIEQLIIDYPFFQSAYLLSAKARAEAGNKSDHHLKLVAAYAGDREQLFELLQTTPTKRAKPKIKKKITAKKKITKTNPVVKQKTKSKIEKKASKKVITKTKLKTITKTVKAKMSIPKKKVQPLKQKETIKLKPITIEAHTFSQWLQVVQTEKKISIKKTVKVVKLASAIKLKQQPVKKLAIKEQKKTSAKKHQTKRQSTPNFNIAQPQREDIKIIQSLIKKQTGKKKHIEVEQLATASIMEDDNLVSETLANIYMQQNNIDKAIAIYEKLRLQHPKKNTYFVQQIEQLLKNK